METLSRWEWDGIVAGRWPLHNGNGDDWWRHKCGLYADKMKGYLEARTRENKSDDQIRSVMNGLYRASKGPNDQVGYAHLFKLDNDIVDGEIDGVQLTATAKKIIQRSIC